MSISLRLGMTQLIAGLLLWPGLAESGEKQYVISSNDLETVNAILKKEDVRHARTLKYSRAVVASLSEGQIGRLKRRLPNAIIEEDYAAEIAGKPSVAGKPAPSSGQSVPWGITAIQARDAHLYNRGAGVRVCIVDTGIQFSHPDLAGQVVDGENFIANSQGQTDPAKYDDDNGHGTHVAGIVAARDNSIGVVGVAPDAKLIAVKVLDRRGSGSTSLIAEGIRSCVAKAANVINMSLAIYSETDSYVVLTAVQEAAAAGVTMVAAAGNSANALLAFPARYSEVIGVTAITSSFAFASFSNWASETDFTAPGVGVYSTTKSGRYTNYDGTSQASPHVAGVIALSLSTGSLGPVAVDIGLTPEQQGQGLINALSTVVNF